jgi:hypothetical protein
MPLVASGCQLAWVGLSPVVTAQLSSVFSKT